MTIIGILWIIFALVLALIIVLSTILIRLENHYRLSIGKAKLNFRPLWIGAAMGTIGAWIVGGR